MDDSPPAGPRSPERFTCPHCGQVMEMARTHVEQSVVCPGCAGPFVVPPSEADGQSTTTPRVQDDELDGLRIQQLAKARRALIRTRSYLLVLVIGCTVVGVQAAWNLIQYVAAGDWGYGAWMTGALIAALVVIAAWAMRRIAVVYRELAGLALPDPAAPPDFSSLGDGSQHHKALDQMTRPPDERDVPRAGGGR